MFKTKYTTVYRARLKIRIVINNYITIINDYIIYPV